MSTGGAAGVGIGRPVSARGAVVIVTLSLALAWLTGTFTGSGLPALLGEPAAGSCGVPTGCWWDFARGPGWSGLSRVLRTLGFFGISLSIGAACLRPRDRRLLQLALGISVLGDLFLVPIPGVMPDLGPRVFLVGAGLFLLAHLVLIGRHLAGLLASLQGPGAGRVRAWYLGLGLLWMAGGLGAVEACWSMMLKLPPVMLAIFLIYVVVLIVGVWAGTTAWLRAPWTATPSLRFNATLIAVGMICFGVTDLAVGVEHLYRRAGESAGCAAIITVIKDMCYTPALLALAASGFVWFGAAETRPAPES